MSICVRVKIDMHLYMRARGSDDKFSKFSSEVVSTPLFFQDKVFHLLGNNWVI